MRRNVNYLLAGACAVILGQTASGAQLSIVPSSQTIQVGDSTSIGVWISGLGDKTAPSLGAFDITIGFDASIVQFFSATMTGELNMSDGSSGALSSSQVVPGGLAVSIVSLAPPGFLNKNQPDSFELFSLSFSGLSPGTSTLQFNHVLLSDENGQEMVENQLSPGSITVGGAAAVPEPGQSGALLVAAGMGLALVRSRLGKR